MADGENEAQQQASNSAGTVEELARNLPRFSRMPAATTADIEQAHRLMADFYKSLSETVHGDTATVEDETATGASQTDDEDAFISAMHEIDTRLIAVNDRLDRIAAV